MLNEYSIRSNKEQTKAVCDLLLANPKDMKQVSIFKE